ncbi:BTAD domain-containing putative transcriptional regulator [Microbispora sp. NPDC049125]|uniref:BTAD domain-containing putative transcriptional regulator n=1 Tax=Microbispora sp. NPDC049125 TaxID=3154929 RepID=UPI0034674416
MRIALLGPLEVRDDAGHLVEITGVRLRTLLARLALSHGRPVTADALIDAIWGGEPPGGAANALQSLVSRLRRALPAADAALVESLPAGYRLAVPEDHIDAGRFERLIAEGRAAWTPAGEAPALDGLATAAGRFAEALRLWRGPPMTGLRAAEFASAAVSRLAEMRLRAVEDLAEARLALGKAGELVAELEELTTEHPLRERLWESRMRALCAAGRPAEALAAFDDLRRTLAETLGADPSPALRALHVAILRGEAGPSSRRAGPRTNLRTPLTSFVGRDEEAERVGRLLDEARLVTLVGPGGAGKTRLAVEVASRRAGHVRDGVWLVELAGVRDPAQVPAAVSAALGLRENESRVDPREAPGVAAPGAEDPAAPETSQTWETSGSPGDRGDARHGGGPPPRPPHDRIEQIAEALRDRRTLIVLDNCEHLIDACAWLADVVAGRCPGVRVLATSREPLAITGEVLHSVGPLRVPPPGVPLEEALTFPAVRLFADRAAAVRPGFSLTAANLPAVAEACRRLDGLPLAIELACARLRTLPVEEIVTRLGDRFRLLTGGSRTALPRHQTLLAVVEWSWDLLTEAERALARRLAVFAAGATPETAEAVCAGTAKGEDGRVVLPPEDVLRTLGALVDKSLVVLLETPGAPPRYRMLDTIRAYAAAALAGSGEAGRVRRAHAAFFLDRAETADPALRTADQLEWLKWLARERGELAAALRWAIDSADAETAVRLTAALGWFWNLHNTHDEAASWLREALALPGLDGSGPVSHRAVARAYAYHAMHHFAIRDSGAALWSAAHAHRLAGAAHLTDPMIMLMDVLVRMHPDHSEADDSAALRHLAGLADSDDPWLAAAARLFRGLALAAFGGAAEAAADLTAARDGFAAVGDRWGMAAAVSSLGSCHSLGGDHAAAVAAMGQAVTFIRMLGSEGDVPWMLIDLALERVRMGDLVAARADLEEAEAEGLACRSAAITASARAGLGELARAGGDLTVARSLLAGALGDLDGVSGAPPQLRARALLSLGRVEIADGDLDAARSRLREGLAAAQEAGDRSAVAGVAEGLAALAVAEGETGEAAGLLGLAAAVRGVPDRGSPDVLRAEAAARATLGEAAHAAAYAATARLGTDAALAALRDR